MSSRWRADWALRSVAARSPRTRSPLSRIRLSHLAGAGLLAVRLRSRDQCFSVPGRLRSPSRSFRAHPRSLSRTGVSGHSVRFLSDPESAVRRTLAVPALSERHGKQPPHSSPISDFLRASGPKAQTPQHRSGAPERSTVASHPLDAAGVTRGRLSYWSAERSAPVGLPCDAFLRTWRQPSHA
jgi:hypothetical protein